MASSWLFKWQCSSLVWSCWPLPSLWWWVSSLSVFVRVSQRDSTSRFNRWSVMSLLSHQWLWLSMEYCGLTMHGKCVCVCVFEPLKDAAIITCVMGGFKGACVCMCVCVMALYFIKISVILGTSWTMLLKRPRILKGITIALCKPLNLVFIRSTMCNFPVCALYTSGLCLSLCWLVCLWCVCAISWSTLHSS